jgi:FAD/FMN-containing dehydrogenase/Fe-S oxidoreductase
MVVGTLDNVDEQQLAGELRAAVRGEVRFDDGTRALYATDASNYRQVPIGVVIPRDAEDAEAAVAVARRFGAPVLPRGGGTSLAGQCCNVAVVLDFSKYVNRLLEMDPEQRRARVQPGLVLDELRDAAERHHLTFAPDPSTHNHCTLGGMIGNNSCGVHSVMGGNTVDNIEELEILTYDGLRLRVGATSDDELEQIIREGGRRGEIYAALKALRNRYADDIRQRYPKLERRVSGFNLDQLLPENGFHVARALVGTEGTCVTVLEAKTRLVYSPPGRSLLVLGYRDVETAGHRVMDIMAHAPLAVEGLDDRLVEGMRRKGMNVDDLAMLPQGGAWLFVEFGGETKAEADAAAHAAREALDRLPDPPDMRVFEDPKLARTAWLIRQSAPRAAARMPGQPDFYDGWEDTAVPPEVLGHYLRELRQLFDRYDYSAGIYGHFSQGCIHTRINFDLKSPEGIRHYRNFAEEAADLVVKYGGSLSGEHGDGQARGELLPRMFGEELVAAFREFKTIWDPQGKMNPGKVVDPYRLDENLRLIGQVERSGVSSQGMPLTPTLSPLGRGSSHPNPLPGGERPNLTVAALSGKGGRNTFPLHFAYREDDGDFGLAMERCIGIGECRKLRGGVMCPSYQVTLEEQHSTRGRARMLFEMLYGQPIEDGWHSHEVKAALDLCLSCKGCKNDCPANVDMATYKAEFLSHYYDRHLRPRTAHTLGLVHRWARLAARSPGLANFLTQTPGLRAFAKAFAGVHRNRRLPAFAEQTFVDWFRGRLSPQPSPPRGAGVLPSRPLPPGEGMDKDTPPLSGERSVLLWPDTFNNYFHPESARAAVEVLEAAGLEVIVPARPVCCGRPLYDYGRLDLAKRMLRETLDTLRPYLAAGVPVVGLEPSCISVFRDELIGLFPDDPDAQRLSQQSFLFAEFLQRYAPDLELPKLEAHAVVHAHCHQKSVLGTGADSALLARLGIEVQTPESGCCGMAGAFGFEREHYDISMQVGERALLPAVRKSDRETLVIADGFSCREQIAQGTGRRALHLSEVVHRALRLSSRGL